MLKTISNQTIALAGIAQAVYLVQQIAARGVADSAAMEASIGSIFKIDADSVEDVFGGLDGIATGLRQLKKQMGGRDSIDPDQARYAAAVVFLERKLAERPKMLHEIRTGIEKAIAQSEHFPPLHENILASLADVYQSTVSTIQPRIMIGGNPTYLTSRTNTDKIRALLLAAIRSAVLWRQCGGNRWKFIFARRKMLDEIDKLLSREN
ncbi:MAG: high frequency lysogenization protein HflD [Pseudomonadota bacterium]